MQMYDKSLYLEQKPHRTFFGTMEEAKAVFEKALEKYKPLLTAKS